MADANGINTNTDQSNHAHVKSCNFKTTQWLIIVW